MWMIVTALLAASWEQGAQPLRLPAWMGGCWEARSGEKWTEECWSEPRGSIMIGYGRSGTGGVLDSWEVMQIEMVETDDPVIDPLTFYGAPGRRLEGPALALLAQGLGGNALRKDGEAALAHFREAAGHRDLLGLRALRAVNGDFAVAQRRHVRCVAGENTAFALGAGHGLERRRGFGLRR